MNKLLKLGLAGILLFNSGCATYRTEIRKEIKEYEKPPIVIGEKKTILKNSLKEYITDLKQQGYKIESFVEERSINIVKCDKLKSEQKVRREDTVTLTYNTAIYESLEDLNRQEGQEEIIDEKTYTDTEEKEEIVYSSEPRAGIPVRFSSNDFRFENGLSEIVVDTDRNGYAATTITSYPLLWRVSETEVLEALGKNLEDQIKDDRIKEIVANSLNVRQVSYPTDIETVKRGSIIQGAGNPYPSEVTNDKERFNVTGFQPDLTQAYNYIQNSIKSELEKRFLASLSVRVRDKETRYPVEGALITFKPKKTLALEELIKGEENIRKRYFVEGSEFFNATRFNPSDLLKVLEGYHSIPMAGTELISNTGSIYEIEVTHRDYKFLESELIFNNKQDSRIIELISLGKKIRTEETEEKKGGITKEK